MFKNYLKTAIRSFLRYKGYTFLNLSGLIVGITCSLLLLLWVQDEWNMDKFHEKDSQLYQMMRNIHLSDGQIYSITAVPQPTKELLESKYPEVDQVAMISYPYDELWSHEEIMFREEGRYVSPEFLEIFSFPLQVGDAASALKDIHSIVISEEMARKYYGDTEFSSILGKTITRNNSTLFTITGIMNPIPGSSSLQFDWLIPDTEFISRNSWVESWFNGGMQIVFTLVEGASIEEFNEKTEQEININTNYDADERLFAQSYSSRYLYGDYDAGRPSGGRIDYVRMMLIVAIFILVIACVNFMNLATARSSRRSLEIGVRKVMGARKNSLVTQFFVESLSLATFATALAVLITYLVLPGFNDLTGKSMLLQFQAAEFWIMVFALILFTGFVAGSYPALMLSSFKTTNSLKGAVNKGGRAALFRKGLVVFQFAISILLIVGTIAVYRQLDFVMSKDLGMNENNMVYIPLEGETYNKFDAYKNELSNLANVQSVTSISGNPLSYGRSTSGVQWEGRGEDEEVEINVMNVSDDFISTMQMEILDGRDFSPEYGTDTLNYLVNEEAARIMGMENPVGEPLSVWGVDGQIVGLVKDFHMSSLHEPIAPLVIRYDASSAFIAFIRIDNNTREALAGIESVTRNINPSFPFRYEFLDVEYAEAYRNEQTISSVANIFAIVAIFISCLGLFGLSSFSAEVRTKEIGIRKVHGASVTQLVLLLSREYALLILIAAIIAIPLGAYFVSGWLDNFTFRVDVGWTMYLISGLLALIIAAVTVSFKSFQAANTNPVNTLKEE